MLVYWVAKLFLLVGRFIPLPICYAIAEALGSAGWLFARGERDKTMRNLRLGLGGEKSEEELRAIGRGMFIHYAKVAFEVTRVGWLKPEKVKRLIEFEGLEPVQEAISRGRGVIAATGHIGNWELMGAGVSALGVPLHVIARRIKMERVNDLVIRLRARAGVTTIVREAADSAKKMLRALKRGEVLALLIDQDVRVEGAFVEFFGTPRAHADRRRRAGEAHRSAAGCGLDPADRDGASPGACDSCRDS